MTSPPRSSTDGPGRYGAESGSSGREGQTPCDRAYVCKRRKRTPRSRRRREQTEGGQWGGWVTDRGGGGGPVAGCFCVKIHVLERGLFSPHRGLLVAHPVPHPGAPTNPPQPGRCPFGGVRV